MGQQPGYRRTQRKRSFFIEPKYIPSSDNYTGKAILNVMKSLLDVFRETIVLFAFLPLVHNPISFQYLIETEYSVPVVAEDQTIFS